MISKIFASNTKKVASQAYKEVAAGMKPVMTKLEKLVADSGCELVGTRGNLAILKQEAAYNKNVMVTHFYDLATTKPTLLKTKEVSSRLNYLPFGMSSYEHPFPEKASFLKQKVDHYPSKVGGFDTVSDYKTRVYDIYGNIIEKSRVKQRNKIDRTYLNPKRSSTTVYTEIQNFPNDSRFVEIKPTRSLNNGTSFAIANTKAGNTNYYIR